jgi:cytochrome P450
MYSMREPSNKSAHQTPVWISVFGIHHDSQSWPNPNKFDPNRFVEKSDAAIKRHPFSYMPFSMKSRAW